MVALGGERLHLALPHPPVRDAGMEEDHGHPEPHRFAADHRAIEADLKLIAHARHVLNFNRALEPHSPLRLQSADVATMTDSLYDRPDLFDLMHPPDPAMERFFVAEALVGGREVLELACGSGRFAIPMALAGATVTGGDLSATMLDRARAAAKERGAAVEFVELDMRNFDLGRQFDTIIVDDELDPPPAHGRRVRGLLSLRAPPSPTGGRLVFDAFVPNDGSCSAATLPSGISSSGSSIPRMAR